MAMPPETPADPLPEASKPAANDLRSTAYISAELRPGSVLGNRYEIIRPLGQGGMGAVYQARDREVDRYVALKEIRPELANNFEMLQRFRQELVLARQVTHPNVVRIYDLGIINELRFLTMEFIEGTQLSFILERRGKLPPREAAEIMVQVCQGLAAAHAVGIVHRDLKPANIMIDRDNRAVLMDFGIARTGEPLTIIGDPAAEPPTGAGEPLTEIGALVGTPMYMSPEQAKGERVDARSDLFAVGIILYELLTGTLPFLGKNLETTLRKRKEEAAIPPMTLNPAIPRALNDIVLKCLATDPEKRYQSTGDLVYALEVFLGVAKPAVPRWKWITMSVAAAVTFSAAFVYYEQRAAENAKPHPPLKVLIADVENRTPDPGFNGALEPLLSFAIEGAPFITSYNRANAHQLAAALRPGTTVLDASAARLVALREGINVVISGSVSLESGKYHVAVEAVDSVKGTPIKSSESTAGNRDEVLNSIARLAATLRTALGDATPESAKLAAAETFSSGSLEAAQRYSQAQAAQQSGQWEDAVRLYGETIQLDPDSGRAYAGMAATLSNMGRRQEAQKYYEIALTKLDRMSEREKYRTRGAYFLLMGEDQQAIEQNKALVAAYPADTAGLSNLAYAYFLNRDMATAVRLNQQAADIYPGNVLFRSNAGLFLMYSGEFETAIRTSREILKINPHFEKAYLCIALSQLGEGKPDEARHTWQQLPTVSKSGAANAALGLADLDLFEGRFSNVIAMLPAAIATDLGDKNKSEAALKQIALAQAYLATGAKAKAVTTAMAAFDDRTDEPAALPAAEILIEAGDEARAMAMASQLDTRFDAQARAYAHVIDGLIQLHRKNYHEAVTEFEAAQKLSDTWLGRLAKGRAFLEAGAFAEADSELDNCVRRRGESTAVFLDDEPSLRYFPLAYYYRGRAREGMHNARAADDYRTFLQFKSHSEGDPLVTDARHRFTGH